jgi:hypothetical protein
LDKGKLEGDEYDKADTFNELKNFIGNMIEMNRKFQELVSSIDGVIERADKLEATVQLGP